MQNQPLSPPQDDALKPHDVRLQDLSIEAPGARGGSGRGGATPPPPPPPPVSEPEREAEQAPSELRSSPFKRKNKRASLSPAAKRKTSLSDVVLAEGELVVAEAHGQRAGDAVVLRTLGSIFCVLLVKNRASLHLETVSPHKHHVVELELGAMALAVETSGGAKFTLRFPSLEPGRPSAYVFECATAAECLTWVDAIASFRSQGESPSPINSSSSQVHSSSRGAGGHTSDANQLAMHRRERSAASLCDPLSPTSAAAATLRSPHSSFVFAAPPKTKHVILVRHGHYINAHERGAPDSQQVLSQMGRQQAEFTGKYLEQLYARAPTRHDITVFHSDMTRAVETAHAIGKDVGHCTLSATPLLREGWPGRPYSSLGPVVQPSEQPAAGGGGRAELERLDAERMELAYQTFFTQSSASSRGRSIGDGGGVDDDDDCDDEEQFSYQVVVCHANLIRFFLCRAMGVPPTGHWGHLEINHCGVSRVDVSEHRPLKILSVNETGHLPPSLITSSEDHL
ncbi:hypothetical protein PybrP1_003276 [[Pythium] brassicae (nom. inval.)]|nr:hypothetical protein PybrP1_003276 [[Pythium] brassicae (nom. inval.)]